MGKENQEPDVRGETRLDSVFWVLFMLTGYLQFRASIIRGHRIFFLHTLSLLLSK